MKNHSQNPGTLALSSLTESKDLKERNIEIRFSIKGIKIKDIKK